MIITIQKIAAIILVLGAQAAHAITAQEVMTKNEQARQLESVIAKVKLTTGGAGAAEKVKEFTWWRKLSGDKVHYNTLTRFHAPAEVKNQGILFLETADKTDIQMYLPSFKKTRRVEAQQQSSSFMGSEFSYADITTPAVADYTHKMLKEAETCAEGPASFQCYVIESTPVSEAVRERTGTSKSVNWIRHDNFMPVKAEFHDLQGAHWKTITFADNKAVLPKESKWLAHNVRVENAKNKKFTTLAFSDVKATEKVPDSTFTVQNLSRER
ncbi:MAG TPA: outer membrane lipoprotein-sorting protein [Bdellovibrionales bacterium]|nr:outer membrane lipoprotein-sorting protein [Bdellovibrionales bacterium]